MERGLGRSWNKEQYCLNLFILTYLWDLILFKILIPNSRNYLQKALTGPELDNLYHLFKPKKKKSYVNLKDLEHH